AAGLDERVVAAGGSGVATGEHVERGRADVAEREGLSPVRVPTGPHDDCGDRERHARAGEVGRGEMVWRMDSDRAEAGDGAGGGADECGGGGDDSRQEPRAGQGHAGGDTGVDAV